MIGARTKILGDITIRNRCKIRARSLVLTIVPHDATTVDVPVRIIDYAKDKMPGSLIDGLLCAC